jgi:N-acetylneuraminic acid mutarotase
MSEKSTNVRICPPDMYRFDSMVGHWELLKTHSDRKLTGRKYYAISCVAGYIFVTGGSDSNCDVMGDFLRFDCVNSTWDTTLIVKGRLKVDGSVLTQETELT